LILIFFQLQLAFARKELTPGLNIELPVQKEYKNDRDGLERKLKSIYSKLDWIERLDVTISKEAIYKLEKKLNMDQDVKDQEKQEQQEELVNNDFKRESLFMKQAELAIINSLPKLELSGVKTKRPEDYFAQMAKSDDHMKKVKEHLLSKHAEMERREKIRKLRELKKMGKQIQIEVQKKKEQAKKKLNDKVKKFKKSDNKDDINILLEDEDDSSKKRKLNENDAEGDKKKPRHEFDKDGKKK
jgi:rRNA-processing protein EBP2